MTEAAQPTGVGERPAGFPAEAARRRLPCSPPAGQRRGGPGHRHRRARASVALAQAIGASIDHMDADAVFTNLDVMRRAGWIITTPLQTRARADTVLLVGDGLPDGLAGHGRAAGAGCAAAAGRRDAARVPSARRPSTACPRRATLASPATSADGDGRADPRRTSAVLRALVARTARHPRRSRRRPAARTGRCPGRGAVRRRGLVGRRARDTGGRDAVRADRRPQQDDPVRRPAAAPAERRRGRRAGRWPG